MRRNDKLRIVGLLAVCFLSAGCSKGDTAPTLPDGAIGFTTNVTRAVRTSLGEGDTFAVWARETPSDGIPSLILTQESVICTDGKWQYTNLQYWKNGATYDFYALYPHSQIATLESADDREGIPYLVIAEFDATQSVDLMTAENTGISYTPPAQPVAFTFRHLLSQVQIVGRLDPALAASKIEVRIISAKLYGMSAKGSCMVRPGDDGTWTEVEATTAVAPFAERNEELMLTDSGEPVFGNGGMLLVPQTVGDDFILEVKYGYK
ncbi:MAG: fimbrillin family protein, partial [Alistipes sp.]|nr:fimbrillin family protein [Alistipes sp.]